MARPIAVNPAIPVIITIAMAEIADHATKEPWPSLENAAWWFDRAGFVLIGALAVGVIATVIIVWMGIVKEHHWDLLRDRSNEKVAALEAETARANAELGNANAEIAKANAQIADAHARAAALEKDSAEARAAIASANARALEAQAELARFKAPRTIGDTDGATKFLTKFAGNNAAIFILGEGPEPNNLAAALLGVLRNAKWQALSWVWSGAGSATGVIVFVKPDSKPEVESAGDAIAVALRAVRIDAIKQPWPVPKWDEFGGMLNGPNPPAPTEAPIRIVIGSKPQ